MTGTIFPDVVRGSLRPLGEAVADNPDLSVGDLRILAEANTAIVRLITDLWGQQYASLDRGANGRVFLSTVNDFLDCLQIAARVIARVDELAAAKGAGGLVVRTASTAAGAEVERLTTALTELKQWLAVPPPATVLAAAAAVAHAPAEDYQDLDAMLGDR